MYDQRFECGSNNRGDAHPCPWLVVWKPVKNVAQARQHRARVNGRDRAVYKPHIGASEGNSGGSNRFSEQASHDYSRAVSNAQSDFDVSMGVDDGDVTWELKVLRTSHTCSQSDMTFTRTVYSGRALATALFTVEPRRWTQRNAIQHLKAYAPTIDKWPGLARQAVKESHEMQFGTWPTNMKQLPQLVADMRAQGHGVYYTTMSPKEAREHVKKACKQQFDKRKKASRGIQLTYDEATWCKPALEYVPIVVHAFVDRAVTIDCYYLPGRSATEVATSSRFKSSSSGRQRR